ncbi:MAG: FmdB family zinc ribbon protein [Porticoccaceae bacterium]
MPIYEYQCQACGYGLEAIQKVSDVALKICPACNKSKLKKKLSTGGFRLSGSGWYETDFKTGNKKNLAGDGAASAGGKNAETAPASSASSTADSAGSGKTSTTAA